MFIEERMNQKLFDPGRGRTSLWCAYISINMPTRRVGIQKTNALKPMPEASHIYRKHCTLRTFDPGRGRTLFLHGPFYKHANPRGWKSIKGRSPIIFVATRSPQNRRGVALKSFPFYIVDFSDARADASFCTILIHLIFLIQNLSSNN